MSPLVVIRLHHRNLQYLQEANADVYTVARFDLNFEHFSISSDLLGSGDCLLEFDFKFPHETLEGTHHCRNWHNCQTVAVDRVFSENVQNYIWRVALEMLLKTGNGNSRMKERRLSVGALQTVQYISNIYQT
jgi:hypothetical protein